MGKMKIGIYCYFITDILTNVLEMFVSGPLPNIHFLSKHLNLCRIVNNISLNENNDFIAVAYALWLLWQLSVSIDL